MKEYKKVLLLIIALVLAGIIVFALFMFSHHKDKRDILMLNDLVKTVKNSWDDPETLDLSRFEMEIIVFGYDNSVIYSTALQELKDIPG